MESRVAQLRFASE